MASSPSPLTGIEPTGNMVKKRAEFTVVLVYVEDPAGHQEEVGLHPGGAELRYAPFGGEGLLLKAHGLPPTTGKSDCQ
jgi:hypothetical protein